MKTEFDEKSCGAVLYQRRNGQLRYLIARSSSGHISFSKGHMEEDETEWETAVREIREETGIKVSLEWILNVYDSIHFNLHMVIITYVCVYKEGQVCLSDEHDEFYWLTIEEMQEMGIPRYMIRDFRYVYDEYH